MKRMLVIICGMAIYTNVQAMNNQGAVSNELVNYVFQHTQKLPHPGTDFVTMSPDSRILLSASAYDDSIMIEKADPDSTCSLMTYKYSLAYDKAIIAPNSGRAALRATGGRLEKGFGIIDLDNPSEHKRYLHEDFYCHYLDFTPDSEKVVASDGKTIRIVNCGNGQIEREIKNDNLTTCFIKEATLYALLKNGIANRMNLTTLEQESDVQYTAPVLRQVRPGMFVGTSSDKVALLHENNRNDVISIHDIKTGKILNSLYFQEAEATVDNHIVLSPNGEKLVVDACLGKGGLSGQFCIADIEKPWDEKRKLISFGEQAVAAFSFAPNNRDVLVVSSGGEAAIFDTDTGAMTFKFPCKSARFGLFSLQMVARQLLPEEMSGEW